VTAQALLATSGGWLTFASPMASSEEFAPVQCLCVHESISRGDEHVWFAKKDPALVWAPETASKAAEVSNSIAAVTCRGFPVPTWEEISRVQNGCSQAGRDGRVRLRVARTDDEGRQLPRTPRRDLPLALGRDVARVRPSQGRDEFLPHDSRKYSERSCAADAPG
jgi:hypothetical protein